MLMTSRERLFAALKGEPTDRTPIWPLFPWHWYGSYVDARKLPHYKRIAELAEHYCITLDRRNIGAKWWPDDVTETWEKTDNAEEQTTRRTLRHKDITLWSEQGTRRGVYINKKLLDSQEDFEAICEFPVETDEKVIEAALTPQFAKYDAEKAEFPAHLGSMMLDMGEPIGQIYSNSNLEELSIASYYEDTRAKITAFLARLNEQKKIIYRRTLERDMADVYFMVGSELAAPPMVGIGAFNKWIVPFAKDLTDIIHDCGKYAIQHYHGQIKHILPGFVEMGADAVHTIESPPVGNCTISEAYDVVGERLALIGNIQYDDFRSMTRDQMRAAVNSLLDEVAGRRFILSPTAGPYDPDVNSRFIENYETFIETGWNYKNQM